MSTDLVNQDIHAAHAFCLAGCKELSVGNNYAVINEWVKMLLRVVAYNMKENTPTRSELRRET